MVNGDKVGPAAEHAKGPQRDASALRSRGEEYTGECRAIEDLKIRDAGLSLKDATLALTP